MIRQAAHLFTAVAVTIAAAAVVRPAAAQPPGPVRLLDVPYLPQTVALCGGAAAAMVMRYWGATGVYAESFADLVIPEEGGIRAADLLSELQARGWDARSFRGDPAFVQRHLAERRPVIALIEDRPGTFHYVVIVAWSGGRVIAHDPARAPFRVLDESAFSTAWSRSGFWSLLALPGRTDDATVAPPAAARATREVKARPCEAMVEEGVKRSVAGDVAAGRRIFEAAAEACPASSAPWRELAGLHVLRQEWPDAAREARRAVRLDAEDAHAWRILATSLYLDGDADGALAAWNAVDEPIIDLVNIRGLNRTRYAVALGVMGLEPQTLLQPDRLARARRRLAELPSAQVSRVTYRPGQGGRAVVDAAIVERPMLPTTVPLLAATGLRAITDRELRVEVASPSGGGEAWTAAWRWWENRPAVHVGFSAPGGRGGLRRVSMFSAAETFGAAGATIVERRLGGVASLADWTTGGTRWEVGAGAERWDTGERAVVLSADVQHRLAGDRAFVRAGTGVRVGGLRTATVAAGAGWQSSGVHEGRVLLAGGGVEAVGSGAPMSTWPGAGIGQARDPLLRAHPLLDGGVISRGAFGRTLAHAGVEWRQWHPAGRRVLRVGPAFFIDAARAWRTAPPFDDRLQVDAGFGLRVALPGAGVFRFDAARGLRDGKMALSAGWGR